MFKFLCDLLKRLWDAIFPGPDPVDPPEPEGMQPAIMVMHDWQNADHRDRYSVPVALGAPANRLEPAYREGAGNRWR